MTGMTLVVLAAVMLVAGALGTGPVPDADALKSRGTLILQYGSDSDICGLEPCSHYPGGKEAYREDWFKSFLNPIALTDVEIPDPDDYYPNHSPNHHSSDDPYYDGTAPSAKTVGGDFAAQLDVYIHKFELDKISVEEALDGITAVYNSFVDAQITDEIVDGVGEKLNLYDSGDLGASDAIESVHLTAEPQNVDPEFVGALDGVIHKFELDKISTDEAIDDIKKIHEGFVSLYIASDLIEAVGVIIGHIDSGSISGSDAIESVHLTAEPQNVDPEFVGALDAYLQKYETDQISAKEAVSGVIEVHDGMTLLYVSSELVDAVGSQIDTYGANDDSADDLLHEIRMLIVMFEQAADLENIRASMSAKELPPNTVDMPAGSGVPGCEKDDTCYHPAYLTASAGTAITWINSDGSIPHTVTSGWHDSETIGLDYPGGNGFDSGIIPGGVTFKHTFEVPGEYDYYCQLHPWMVGSITVQ